MRGTKPGCNSLLLQSHNADVTVRALFDSNPQTRTEGQLVKERGSVTSVSVGAGNLGKVLTPPDWLHRACQNKGTFAKPSHNMDNINSLGLVHRVNTYAEYQDHLHIQLIQFSGGGNIVVTVASLLPRLTEVCRSNTSVVRALLSFNSRAFFRSFLPPPHNIIHRTSLRTLATHHANVFLASTASSFITSKLHLALCLGTTRPT